MLSRLGRFEINAEIGRGGFGQVFRAHDPLMNRIVAVKVLTATEDAGSFNRFKNEATAAGNLRHENIVTVYEFGQEGQIPFLVMEYLNGEDLHNIITNQSPLSLYQKVRIMDRVADGLHCAHINGVLHRDVKPANIMALKDGGVKIMDFGIARLERDTSPRLTKHGYLIGTVVYMAPELFAGGEWEFDALCDIWSFGVVMYELLSGTNPFRTGSLQSEMYKIVNLDPAPLPPETCPDDLQAVISRLISRKRGLRYQTLEETRFDLEPILNNLKKAEADRLVSVAQQQMFERQWAAALDTAREARKMDPRNGTARIIFDRIQDELRKQSLHPRIDDLIRRGNEAAEQKNIPEAISHLEAALRFDSTNEPVILRLHELRSLKAKLEEAVSLVSEAGERFRSGRLTDAFEHASEAVLLDPDNEAGRQLLDDIQSAIRKAEAERAMNAEILRARGLMAIDDLDGALESLKTADSNYPGNNTVKSLMTQISARIAERERRLEFSRRLDHAKAAVRSAQFDEAVQELEQLLGASPNEGEVADLLAYARQELKAKVRREELKRITDAAVELNRTQQFSQAIQVLEEGLKEYPDDLSLTRLLRSAYFELQNRERDSALRAGLERCEALRRNAKWQEALNLIALLVSDNPNHRELAALDVKIRQERDQAKRTAAIRSAVEEAGRLLRERQPDAAVKVLEDASLIAGADAEVRELRKKAEAARQAERDRQYIESELKHAQVFEARGDLATSLKIIDGALRRSPKSPELLAARERLSPAGLQDETTKVFSPEGVNGVRVQEAPERLRQKLDAVGQALEAANWQLAMQVIEQARKECGNDPALAPLEARALDLRRTQLESAAEAIRGKLRENQFDDATMLFDQNLARYPDQNVARAVAEEIGALKSQRASISKQLADRAAAIANDLERGNWQEALKRTAAARAAFPESASELNSLERQARELRERELKKLVDQAKGCIRQGRRTDAEKILNVQLAPFAGDPVVAALAKDIAAAVPAPTAPRDREELHAASRDVRPKDIAAAVPTPPAPRDREELHAASRDVRSKDIAAAVPEPPAPRDRKELPAASRDVRPKDIAAAVPTPPAPRDREELHAATPDLRPKDIAAAVPEPPAPRDPEELHAATPDVRPNQKFRIYGIAGVVLAGLAGVVLWMRPAAIEVSPEKLSFAYQPGSSPAAQKIIVTGSSNVTAPRTNANWVKVTRGPRASGKTEFAVQVLPEKLQPGTYTELLAFSQDKKVTVNLVVPQTGPTIQPASLTFPYSPGGVPGQKIVVTDSAPIPNPKPSEPWLTFTRHNLGAGKAEFLVQVSGNGLSPGLHNAFLTFPAARKVPVALIIPGGSTSGVYPAYLAFSGDAEQKVTFMGPGDIPDPTPSEPWLTFTRDSVSPGKVEFLVKVSTSDLDPGKYHATLTFPADRKVQIDLTVPEDLGTLEVKPDSLAFSNLVLQQTITVTGPINIPNPTVTDPWVKFTRRDLGAGIAEFDIHVNAAGLVAGPHVAYVNFSPVKKVRVVFTVTSGR